MSKLALGSAQFGLDYGINNNKGKIPAAEVFLILDEAYKYGIDTLDTAAAYGVSEKVIGEYQNSFGREFKIVSKVPKCAVEDVESFIGMSLKQLQINSIYGYLVHDYKTYKANQKVLEILKDNKSRGRIKKIGLSLYYPSELDELLAANVDFDIVQVPYNIFDQRFNGYFIELKKKGVEIHVRSVFLQGLVFKKINELDGIFLKMKEKLSDLDRIAESLQLSRLSLCLNFVMRNLYIDKVVIGIDSIRNLQEIIAVVNINNLKDMENIKDLNKLIIDDDNIINPSNWNKKI